MTHDKHLLANSVGQQMLSNFCWSCVMGLTLQRANLVINQHACTHRQAHVLKNYIAETNINAYAYKKMATKT